MVFITLATDLPTETITARISDEHINDSIRRAVNDGFTITKDDKEFFESIIRNEYSSHTESGGVIEDPRIVDGEEAALGALPYQCALQFRSTGFSYCGAALIDPLKTGSAKWVITADHCVKDRLKDTLQVVCGVLKMSQTKDWNRFEIDDIVEHEYSSVSKIGDVALIRLKERADVLTHRADPSSNGMTPIDIPDMSTFRQFAGKSCTVSGWGRQVSGASTKPDTLNRVLVKVPTQQKCSKMYENVTDKFKEDSMMCAGGEDRDACQGDSGGPLMCEVNGKMYLAGLVSWGIGCATEGVPGGYTQVAHYRPWIVDKIRSHEKAIAKVSSHSD